MSRSVARTPPIVSFVVAFFAAMLLGSAARGQELVITTGNGVAAPLHGSPVMVLPDASAAWPEPPRNFIATNPGDPLNTHGLAFVAANRVLVSQVNSGSVRLLDTGTLSEVDSLTISPDPGTGYNGLGTLAVDPTHNYILALTNRAKLWVIHAPFDHTATVTSLALPGFGATYHTRSVAFDNATGRAYVAVHNGILALDPPYTSIAYTIPLTPLPANIFGVVPSSAIALSPDGTTLVSPDDDESTVRIYHAPFSAASVADVATIAGASLDSPVFTPDGSGLLIVDDVAPKLYVLTPPFSATPAIDTIGITVSGVSHGFEDVEVSPDGQLAALAGQGFGSADPIVLLHAPFTSVAVTQIGIKVPPLADPYDAGVGSRGDGTAKFWPTPIPVAPPQILIDSASVAEGDAGTTSMTFHVTLSAPSAQTVTVDYATAPGSATTIDHDYVDTSGTLTFAPGETAKTIAVPINGDTQFENNERFAVALTNPVNATLLVLNGGRGTIMNDDASEPLAITTTSLPPATAGAAYSVTLAGTGKHPFTWNIAVPPGGLALDPLTGVLSGTPVSGGTYTVTVQLTSADHGIALKDLTLVVAGPAAPSVQLVPSNPFDFGTSPLGVDVSAIPGVINNGGADLVLATPFATLAPNPDFAIEGFGGVNCTDGMVLAPGDGCGIGIGFAPSTPGARSATLVVHSNAPDATLTLLGTGGAGAFLTLTPIPVAFGNQPVGTTSAAHTVTVTNTGTQSVTLDATPAEIGIGDDYALANGADLCTAGQVLAVGATCHLYVTFTPTASGDSGDILYVRTSVSDVFHVALQGTGGGVGTPLLTAAPNPASFGNQVVGVASALHTVTVANNGGADLVLASPFAVFVAGDFASAAGANLCTAGATLAPGDTCNLYYRFTPSAVGVRTTNIGLQSSAPPVTLVLDGVGVDPGAPAVSLSPGSLAFGTIAVGSISAPQTVTLTNTGGAALALVSIVVSGDFTQATTCGATLAPGAGCTIAVAFAPAAPGPRSGSVTISDDAAGSPHVIVLSGTGVANMPPPAQGPLTPAPVLSPGALIALAALLALLALSVARHRDQRAEAQ